MRIKTTISVAMIVLGTWSCLPVTGWAADTTLENMRSTVGNSREDLENYRKLLVEFEKAKLKAKDQAGATAAKLEIIKLDRELGAMDGGASRRASKSEDAGPSAAEKAAADKLVAEKAAAEKAAATKVAAEKVAADKAAAAEKVAAEKAAVAKAAAEKLAAEKAAAEKAAAEKFAADKAVAARAVAEKAVAAKATAAAKVAAEEAAAERALAAIVAAEKVAAEKAAAEKAVAEKIAAEKAAAEKAAAKKAAAEKAAAEKVAAEKAAAEKIAAKKAAAEKLAAEQAAAEKAMAERIAAERAAAERISAEQAAARKAAAEQIAAEKVAALLAASEKAAAAEETAARKATDEAQRIADLKSQLRQLIAQGNDKLSAGDVQGAREVKTKVNEIQEELTRLGSPAGGVTNGKSALLVNGHTSTAPAPAHAPSPVPAPAPAPVPDPAPAPAPPPAPASERISTQLPAPQSLTPILRGPKTQVSSVQGLAGSQNTSKNNVYVFNLSEVGPTTTLTYYATGRRSKDTAGNIWLVTPGGLREKVGAWKSGQFEISSTTEASSYTKYKPATADISGLVKGAGEYKIEFEWTDGIAPLIIHQVEITS